MGEQKRLIPTVIMFASAIAAAIIPGVTPLIGVLIMIGGSIVAGVVSMGIVEKTPKVPSEGRKENTRTTEAPLPIIYGQVQVGGNDVYIKSTGSNNKYLWVVQTLAEGICEGIATRDGALQIWISDKIYTDYGSKLDYWFHSGTPDHTIAEDDDLYVASEGEWTDTLRNTCFIIWKFTWDSDKYQSFPEKVIELKGLKVYDFRNSTTAWSNNPVLCLYDFMTNARYGLGYVSTYFDIPSWTSAANYCESKGWTLNTAIYGTETAQDTLDMIVGTFRGQIIWYDGKFYLRYADLNEESSVMNIKEEHIVRDDLGKASLSIAQPSMFKKPDGLRVSYIDAEKKFVTDYVMVGDTIGYIEEISFDGVTSRQQVSDLGIYALERQQLDRLISGTFRDDCAKLEPHDVITFTYTPWGIESQLMRVQETSIQPNGLVNLTLMWESASLYDDDYDLITEGTYTCSLPDPSGSVPSIGAVVATVETYNFRLRTATRLKITFSEPVNYAWYHHIEVWQSLDSLTYEHLFDTTNDFEISNVQEGATYYLKLRVVNIWGAKESLDSCYILSKYIEILPDLPSSLTELFAVANQNSVNLFSTKVSDPDIELYEFRLGTSGSSSWSAAVLLGAFRAPNLSLQGVKPGTHTFLCDTLATNNQYSGTPKTATVVLQDPPDGWTLMSTKAIDTVITNGNMETNGSWTGYGTPTSNAQSSGEKHEGTWSWKFVSGGANKGIKSAVFTSLSGEAYGGGFFVYPPSGESKVGVVVRKGNNSGDAYTHTFSGLSGGGWNEVYYTYTEGAATGGASAYVAIVDPDGVAGTWYVDDVIQIRGTFSNAHPILYSSDANIKGSHVGNYTGTYTTPVFDLGASGRYMAYVLANIILIGEGSSWASRFPSPTTWEEGGATTLSWRELFELTASSSVAMKLYYGETSNPTDYVGKQEILSAIVTGRYFKIEITITDPNSTTNALVETTTLKFLQ